VGIEAPVELVAGSPPVVVVVPPSDEGVGEQEVNKIPEVTERAKVSKNAWSRSALLSLSDC
jgi:hypothetical protein